MAYLPAAIEAFTPKVVSALTELAESVDVPMGRAPFAGPPSLVLARAFDEPNVTYDGALTDVAAMGRFVRSWPSSVVTRATTARCTGYIRPSGAPVRREKTDCGRACSLSVTMIERSRWRSSSRPMTRTI